MLYPANQIGPYRVPGFYDPDSKRIITVIFRPEAWTAGNVYYKRSENNYDTVIPTTFKGLYARVKYPGLSGGTDPFTGIYREGDEVTDGTVTWEMKNYNLLPPDENISTSPGDVTYTPTHSVTVSGTSNTASRCTFMISSVPAAAIAAQQFEITIHYVKTNNEEGDATLLFIIGGH